MTIPAWLSLCLSRSVARRAAASALIVGTVLVLINHGAALLTGSIDKTRLFQIGLTVLVPYVVSTISSVLTIMEMRR